MAKSKHDKEEDVTEIKLSSIISLVSSEWFIISALFIFSLAIHIMFKATGLFHFDSVFDTIMVERSIASWTLNYSYGWGAPGMIIIVGFFYLIDHLLTGAMSAERAYFIVTFLSAALSSVVMYLLVKKFSNKFVAVSSSLLFSVSALWLTSTTYPKTHSLGILFSLLSGLLLLSAAEKKSVKMMIWAGISAGIAMSIRPIDGGFIMIPLLMIYLHPKIKGGQIVLDKEKMNLKNMAALAIPAFLVLLALFIPRIMSAGGVGAVLAQLGGETRGGWMGFYSAQLPQSLGFMTTTVTYFGWAAVAIGILYLIKKREAYLLSSISVWFLIFFLYIGNLAVVDSRFLIPAIPPLCILMAFGADFIYEKHSIAGILVVILLAILMFSVGYPLIKARHEYSGQKEFAEFVEASTQPNSLIMTGDDYVFINRYGHRQNLYFGNQEKTMNIILANLLNGTHVYAVESSFPFMSQYERDTLSKYFLIGYVGDAENEVYQFSALELKRYREKLFEIRLNESAVAQAKAAQEMRQKNATVSN
ncbi:MAG: glycosyltransferase family 39 protein [Candidatus Woesearchaeota archaeon]|nr:glycosyltransferase family 39 protein [Candidatus Woesearchaeota archaeon]